MFAARMFREDLQVKRITWSHIYVMLKVSSSRNVLWMFEGLSCDCLDTSRPDSLQAVWSCRHMLWCVRLFSQQASASLTYSCRVTTPPSPPIPPPAGGFYLRSRRCDWSRCHRVTEAGVQLQLDILEDMRRSKTDVCITPQMMMMMIRTKMTLLTVTRWDHSWSTEGNMGSRSVLKVRYSTARLLRVSTRLSWWRDKRLQRKMKEGFVKNERHPSYVSPFYSLIVSRKKESEKEKKEWGKERQRVRKKERERKSEQKKERVRETKKWAKDRKCKRKKERKSGREK